MAPSTYLFARHHTPILVIDRAGAGAELDFEAGWCCHVKRDHVIVGVPVQRAAQGDAALLAQIGRRLFDGDSAFLQLVADRRPDKPRIENRKNLAVDKTVLDVDEIGRQSAFSTFRSPIFSRNFSFFIELPPRFSDKPASTFNAFRVHRIAMRHMVV